MKLTINVLIVTPVPVYHSYTFWHPLPFYGQCFLPSVDWGPRWSFTPGVCSPSLVCEETDKQTVFSVSELTKDLIIRPKKAPAFLQPGEFALDIHTDYHKKLL